MNKKRIYNVLFHLHTVSGIVISMILFIIFFAGAFTMFREEIQAWEQGKGANISITEVDYDKIYSKIENEYNLTGRNVIFNLSEGPNNISVFIESSNIGDALEEDKETHFLIVNANDYKINSYEENYSYAEFIYRLHYLSQIPYIGPYLAGLVSFFFLFALLTGLYIHWDKIGKNFIHFRPKFNFKNIWKEAHTVLGTIAFPFQLIYAITGSFFCLSILVLLPAYGLYGNDSEKLMADMRPERAHANWEEVSNDQAQSINQFIKENYNYFQGFEVYNISIENINGSNMSYELIGDLSEKVSFTGRGSYAVNAYSLEKLHEMNPTESDYSIRIRQLLGRLHFGNFGGIYIKFVYAFLAFLTCFIIISGVMLWLVSREKNNIPEKRRKFNRKVVNVYLSVCLSMIPVTAFGFIAAKVLPLEIVKDKELYYYTVYFILWLIFTVYFIIINNFQFTLKTNVLLGGILFCAIPFWNGFTSGNWLWSTANHSFEKIFIVDSFCLIFGIIAIYTYILLRKSPQNN